MACFHPIDAWQSKWKKDNGKSSVLFSTPTRSIENFDAIKVPCGQCVGCRLERSRKWAMRCMHEMQMHEDNCFITLLIMIRICPQIVLWIFDIFSFL